MNEFDDDCHAWETCAQQYYDTTYYHEQARHLFVEKEGESRGYADDATWILTSSFVIFTMQSGFGLLEAGSCSPGFEVNIMMKNIVDVVFTALTYYLVGYGISFGTPATPFSKFFVALHQSQSLCHVVLISIYYSLSILFPQQWGKDPSQQMGAMRKLVLVCSTVNTFFNYHSQLPLLQLLVDVWP